MRLWSFHPGYLDSIGLVAVWREALLAKAILESRVHVCCKNPQLDRFRRTANPVRSINAYLQCVYEESVVRGYRFDVTKFDKIQEIERIPVTVGQIRYEFEHFMKKLKARSSESPEKFEKIRRIEAHPLFYTVEGGIEEWERVRK